MPGFRITCEIDTSELERDWARSCNVLSDGVRRGVAMGVAEGAAEARSSHAYKDRTGALTKSIQGRVEVSAPGAAEGVIEALEPYASFVEEGTQPHEIRPKAGEGSVGPLRRGQSRRTKTDIGTHRVALRWTEGGQVFFARVVHHPGGKPYPFMGPAVQKAERVIEREVDIAIAEVASIMSG